MIKMEFTIFERILGQDIEVAYCHVDTNTEPHRAWIEIVLIDGLPLDSIMKNIEHEVLHWTIFHLEGLSFLERSEEVVRAMMNNYPPDRIALVDEY